MGATTKRQEYTYNYRSASVGAEFSRPQFMNRGRMRLEMPDDLLEVKNVWSHLIVRFNENVAANERAINQFGIGDDFLEFVAVEYDKPHAPITEVNRLNQNIYLYDVNVQADSSRYAEVFMDLTPALDPTNRNYAEVLFYTAPISGTIPFSEIILWKIDATYTTQEIR